MPQKPRSAEYLERKRTRTDPNANRQLPLEELKAVDQIIIQLNEKSNDARKKIFYVVQRMGLEFAHAILQETMAIESQGGAMTLNGKRRRTPGGLFLYLARGKMPTHVAWLVFHPTTPQDIKRQKIARKILAKQKRKQEAAKKQEPGT